MLKVTINWDLLNKLEETVEKLENIFVNSELIAKFVAEKKIGVIHKLNNEEYIILYCDNKYLNNDDIANTVNKGIIFKTLSETMNYLRDVRFDHAINYEIRTLTEPLLGELYKNRKIEIKDILGV